MSSNPIWPVPLLKGEIWTQARIEGRQYKKAHGGDGCLQAKEEGLEKALPLRFSEGANPADILIFDFQCPEPWDNTYLIFKLWDLWYFVMATLVN